VSAIARAKDIRGFGELVADHVYVHAQRDGGVGVSEPGGDDVDRDAGEQQGRGMDVA